MTRTHRLDQHDVDPRPLEGVVRDPKDSRNRQPDERYPKGSDTDYRHDQQATRQHSPGPFHGDDLVTQQLSPDIEKRDYVHDEEVNRRVAEHLAKGFRSHDAVDVRIVDEVVKSKTVRHQVTVQEVQPGTAVRVLGKDPTRVQIQVSIATGTNAYICPPDITTSMADATAAQFFFPIPSSGSPLKFNSEEELWVYVGTDKTAAYVQMLCEYVRSTDTREEHYDG